MLSFGGRPFPGGIIQPQSKLKVQYVAVPAAIASQLASAGTTGMAAAAAISSTKKRKRSHSFETNPSIRKRQQTRLLRKLRVCKRVETFTHI